MLTTDDNVYLDEAEAACEGEQYMDDVADIIDDSFKSRALLDVYSEHDMRPNEEDVKMSVLPTIYKLSEVIGMVPKSDVRVTCQYDEDTKLDVVLQTAFGCSMCYALVMCNV